MMNDMETFFSSDDIQEIQELLDTHAAVLYFAPLQEAIDSKDRSLLPALIESGLERLANEEDNTLADYFFILSEIKDIPEQLRNFLMDVMVWCEENETYRDAATWKDASAIQEHYEQHILAILKN